MNHLDLCSGIGGFALAADWAGMTTIGFCEIDPFCQRVLRKHWPETPIHDDLRTLTGDIIDGWGRTDLVTAGYPCQPFSHAGRRMGQKDDRHLWPYIAEIVEDLRPPWCLFENVAGHVTLGLDDVLFDLETLGYSCEALVVPACAVDAPHRRDRVWVLANAGRGNGERFSNTSAGNERDRGDAGWQEASGWLGERSQDAAHPHGQREPQSGGPEPDERGWFSNRRPAVAADAQGVGKREPSNKAEPVAVGGEARKIAGGGGLRSHAGRAADDADGGRHGEEDGALRSGRSRPELATWREVEPLVRGGNDGLPYRVDRLRALGNAIVPHVAYEFMTAIREATGA